MQVITVCNAKGSVGNDLKMMEMRFLKIKLYNPFRYYFSTEAKRKGYLFCQEWYFPRMAQPRRHHKFPRLGKYQFFRCKFSRLEETMRARWSRLNLQHTRSRRSWVILVQQARKEELAGKFWKNVGDRSALDSILQNHLPLLAALTWNF